jgi:DNA-binding CsgD family transcriptional regulator
VGVYLSANKLALLRAATAVLLTPFSYESGEEWRRAVCAAVEPLVDARGSVFGFALPDERLLGGSPDVVGVLEPFMPPTGWMSDGFLKFLRAQRFGVIEWRDIYDCAVVKKTDFYSEIVRPNKVFAPLMLVADVPGTLLGAAIFNYSESESKADARAEERKELLELLVPAFRAGVSAYTAMRHQRETLKVFGEISRVPLMLFDRRGRVLHESRAFERLLGREPEAEHIRAAARRVAANLSGSVMSRNPLLHTQEPIISRVNTRGGRYSISAISFGNTFGYADVVGVLVEDVSAPRLDAEKLTAEFHLTKRELQTAALLQRRLPTKEIAAALGVSVNTARRHTEHVMSKLGVHSRSDATVRLNGDGKLD